MLSLSEKLNVFIEGLKSLKQNDMKNMLALSQERFSARKFTSEAVSQEDLDYIMQQGRRIKLRCPPKVLTGTLHPSLPSIFSG